MKKTNHSPKRVLRFFVLEFLLSGHPQSLGASAIVYLCDVLTGLPINNYLYVVVYLVFQFVYLNDRYRSLKYDELSNSTRTKHLMSYKDRVPMILFLYCFGALTLSLITISYVVTLYSIFIMLMGFLYPIYFKPITKKIFIFKNIYVSSVFSLLTVYSILSSDEFIFTKVHIFLMVYIFMETISMQFLLDVKDVSVDASEGLKTMPVVVGKKSTYLMVVFISIISFIFIYLAYGNNYLLFVIGFLSLASNTTSLAIIEKIKVWGYVFVASKYFLWWGVLLCFN